MWSRSGLFLPAFSCRPLLDAFSCRPVWPVTPFIGPFRPLSAPLRGAHFGLRFCGALWGGVLRVRSRFWARSLVLVALRRKNCVLSRPEAHAAPKSPKMSVNGGPRTAVRGQASYILAAGRGKDRPDPEPGQLFGTTARLRAYVRSAQ